MMSLALSFRKCNQTKVPSLTEIKVTESKNLPLFSSWSCLIWRFSCWIPRTKLERGRCLATWLSVSISSWYCQEITKWFHIKWPIPLNCFLRQYFYNSAFMWKKFTRQILIPKITLPVSWLLLACWATLSAQSTSQQHYHGYEAFLLMI